MKISVLTCFTNFKTTVLKFVKHVSSKLKAPEKTTKILHALIQKISRKCKFLTQHLKTVLNGNSRFFNSNPNLFSSSLTKIHLPFSVFFYDPTYYYSLCLLQFFVPCSISECDTAIKCHYQSFQCQTLQTL